MSYCQQPAGYDLVARSKKLAKYVFMRKAAILSLQKEALHWL